MSYQSFNSDEGWILSLQFITQNRDLVSVVDITPNKNTLLALLTKLYIFE